MFRDGAIIDTNAPPGTKNLHKLHSRFRKIAAVKDKRLNPTFLKYIYYNYTLSVVI